MEIIASPVAPLARAERADNALNVTWADDVHTVFHYIWLRDNCRCPECGEPEIGRRVLKLTEIALDVSVSSAEIEPGDSLKIRWSDGHETWFAGDWLRFNSYDDEARRRRVFTPTLWSDSTRKNPPAMAFDPVNSDGAGFLKMLHHVRDLGLCFLRDAPADADTLERLALKIGPLQESNFGRVQDLIVDHSKRTIANDVTALKPHTDEPYRASPPGVLLFHCLETDTTGGGSSTFLDGFEIAEVLRSEDPEGFAALASNRQSFRRYFSGEVDVVAEFPVISIDEFGNLIGVRINDRVAAPLSIPPKEVPAYYRGLRRLLDLAEDPERMIRHTLRPGDIVIFDNHRILHGRTALTLKGRRWLRWIQVERGDFHSTLRITADRLQQNRDASPLLRGAYG